ncbi:hypothetical protein VTN77DRAFT_2203 [Rasamsonia byssochlamydoides]|uniref:uncharacterized protein n=1 Tax=Rasamsonia byssochlamydoides TaxID=89139 RepID=UPI003744123A
MICTTWEGYPSFDLWGWFGWQNDTGVAFGRGSRVCLGLNLAELYLALGMIFRRFEFKLYETDVTDV